jgi:putative Mn2+ efflux pump MntP
MSLLSHTALAFSMSADAFAASLSKGVGLSHPRLREALRIGCIFGGIETITPLVGWGLGRAASSAVESVDHWIAFSLLLAVGLKMLWESQHAQRPAPRASHRLGVLVLTAIGTSIDAMAVGASLAFIDASIVQIALMIGGATFLMTTLGVMAGHYVGMRAGRVAEALGGVCLIAIGTHILLTHLGYLA